MLFRKTFSVNDNEQKRVYIIGLRQGFLGRPACKVGLWPVSRNLDFRKGPNIP